MTYIYTIISLPTLRVAPLSVSDRVALSVPKGTWNPLQMYSRYDNKSPDPKNLILEFYNLKEIF